MTYNKIRTKTMCDQGPTCHKILIIIIKSLIPFIWGQFKNMQYLKISSIP